MIRKNPFLIFCLVITLLVSATVLFIQSKRFTDAARRLLASRFSPSFGIDADFEGLSIQYFPPGLSILKPKVALRKRNIVGLPEGSQVTAERIELNFKPIQMLTGSIRINEFKIVNGDIQLEFDKIPTQAKPKSKKAIPALRWDELFHVHADSVGIENTRVRLKFNDPQLKAEFLAKNLSVSQWSGKGGVGYAIDLDIENISGEVPKSWKIPKQIKSVRAKARINSLGLTVENFSTSIQGVDLSLNGKVDGNLLERQDLPFDVAYDISGDPRGFKLPVDFNGSFRAQGKAQGNLEKIGDTLRGDIKLDTQNVKIMKWEFDSGSAQADYQFKAGSPEINLEKLVIAAAEKPRVGGVPASGGKVTVSGVRWKYGSSDLVHADIKIERAHVHWLAPVVRREIFPLDMRVSGQIVSVIKPTADWNLRNEINLVVGQLDLDNGKMGVVKPLTKVLSVQDIRVSGIANVNSEEVKLDSVNIALKESKFKASGKISFSEGLDITAAGNVQLKEIGQLAEQDIRGQGPVKVHVHGPTSRVFVDFMPELQDGEYLGLHLGAVRGKITFDEDPTHLLFSDVQGKNGKTTYVANGMIDLGSAEPSINLKVDVPDGEVENVIDVLREKVKDISWFPWGATGSVSGRVGITGGLNTDLLQIRVECIGSDWEYVHERFKRVIATGGYDRGRFYADSVRAVKKTGRLNGAISFRPKNFIQKKSKEEEQLSWSLSSEDFSLADIDHISRLDVPAKGNLDIKSHGEEKDGKISSETQISLKSASARGISIPPSEFHMSSENGRLNVKGEFQGSQGLLQADYPFQLGEIASLKVDFNRFDFSHALLMLNPKLIQDQDLAAYFSGGLDLSFQSGKIELGSGKASISEFVMSKKGTRFALEKPGEFAIHNGTFRVDQLSINGKEGSVKLTMNSNQAEVAGLITGDVHLGMIEFFTPVIRPAVGLAKIDLSLTGYLKSPDFLGKASVNGASFQIAGTDFIFENVGGQVQLRQNRILVKSFEGDLASGRVNAKGTVDLFTDRVPAIDLTGNLVDNKLKIFPFQFVKINGALKVHGTELPYLVEGKIVSDSAMSREKVLNQKRNATGKDRFTPSATLLTESNLPIFKLNIQAVAERGILVQNDLFDAELKGDLKIINTIENPGILGTTEVIHGKMSFKDRVFQIQSAKVEFDNPTALDPAVNMVATTEVNRTKIQMLASGRLPDKLKIVLTSNPVMPESDIISVLALGMSNDDFQKMRAGDRKTYEQGEATSLLLNSLDFNRDIQKRTGFQVQLDEANYSQLGMSAFRPRTDVDSTSAPRIVVKRKLGKKLDLSAGSTVGVGTTNQRQVTTEYRFTPAFSLLGVWDYIDSSNFNTFNQSYGVDLKLQKRFK